jgi:hypothetical protein
VNGAVGSALACPRCGGKLPMEVLEPQGSECSGCETHVEAAVFPALLRADESSRREPVVSDEAACFFHYQSVAMFSCNRCGRFLCALCRVMWAGENVCTACLEATTKDDQARAVASSRFHFDSLALALATLPVLTWIFSLVTAPLALGFALVTWRRECSIVPRSKLRFVAAVLLSVLTIASWIVFWIYVARRGVHPGTRPVGVVTGG